MSAVAMSLLLGATPAFADVACVQRELARIGLDPGPIDGQLGGRTLSAARTFQKGAIYLEELSVDSAFSWCEDLRTERPFSERGPQDLPWTAVGVFTDPALSFTPRVTPTLGTIPEYKVPDWVNNPH